MHRYDRVVVLTNLPTQPEYHLGGGTAYGVEPLTLPYPGEALQPTRWSTAERDEIAATCRRLAALPRRRAGGPPSTQPDQENVYWFRWITGHQLSFLVWRWATLVLHLMEAQLLDPNHARRLLRMCVDSYSGLLLYTGSCPPSLYHRLIRPSMHLRHPAFSGSWAPDFPPVRRLFRGRATVAEAVGPDAAALRDAVTRNQRVHELVAAKLVPNGVSLLRAADPVNLRQDMRVLNLIFDNYFMTVRAPLTRGDFLAQLLRRVYVVNQDLAMTACVGGDTLRGDAPAAQRPVPADLDAGCGRLPQELLGVAEQAAHGPAGLLGDVLDAVEGISGRREAEA